MLVVGFWFGKWNVFLKGKKRFVSESGFSGLKDFQDNCLNR
jgi:hypothetical protein